MSTPNATRALTLRLAWAQLRHHRAYSVWISSLLTVMVAMVSYVMFMSLTQSSLTAHQPNPQGWIRERWGWVTATFSDADAAAASQPGSTTIVPLDQLMESVAASKAQDALAITQTWFATIANPDFMAPGLDAVAVTGATSQFTVAQGRMPSARGEVALSADAAARLHASIGDAITVYRLVPDESMRTEAVELTVVGLTPSHSLPGFELSQPDAWFDWSEVATPDGLLTSDIWVPADESRVPAAYVTLQWNGGSPLLDPYSAGYGSASVPRFPTPAGVGGWYAVAGVLALCMVVMSFAVGRSQAAARTQWVATVRTLGARRRALVTATVVETAFITLGAAVLGVALGWLAAQSHLSVARARTPLPPGSALVPWDWRVPVIATAVAILVGVVIAAVPAFWATRVAPVAALKPVSDITEAELSRRVSVLWLLIPCAAGLAVMQIPWDIDMAYLDVATVLGAVVFVLTAGALGVEGMRRLVPYIGRRLGRSSRPAVLTTGDLLAGRPRQAVAPTLISAVVVGGVAVWVLRPWRSWSFWEDVAWTLQMGGDLTVAGLIRTMVGGPTWAMGAIAGACVIVVLATIYVSQRSATGNEVLTRQALGLSRADTVTAHTLQQWVPQAVGSVLGLLVGVVVGWWLLATEAPSTQLDSWATVTAGTELQQWGPYLPLVGFVFLLLIVAAWLAVGYVVARAVAAFGESHGPRVRAVAGE